jgi:ABC-type antimicrobial peptide transport system permease subunit
LVGLVANSVLQGRLVVSEENFIALFPGAGGYRTFLVDAPPDRAAAVSDALTRRLRNRGAAVETAAARLDAFNVVQNTYLGIFTVLGGLGLLLGTAGLAVVVARNVIERKGELGVLSAVGFTPKMLRQVVLGEHWFLHAGGVATGTAAALVAVWPAVTAPGAQLPAGLLAGLVAAVLAGGLAFCWLAGALALKGGLLEAVRSE